jgi:hypothetical protein
MGFLFFEMIPASISGVWFIVFKHELGRGTKPTRRSNVPYWKEEFRLGSVFCDTKSKKSDGCGDRLIDEDIFFNEKKPSSTMVPKMPLNNGEHTLIPVSMKMIHFTVYTCKKFMLKDGRPLHMVKFVGAVMNYHDSMKNIRINVEDGTGLLQVIVWHRQNECKAAQE